jgi:predicted peptidase
MKPFYIIFALLWISTLMGAQDYSLFEKYTHYNSAGDSIPYRLLLPDHYDANQSYPLVLFLHGAGERGNDNEAQLMHGVKAFLTDEYRAAYPCIVIAPQCPADSYWSSADVDRSSYPVKLKFDYKKDMTKGLSLAMDLLDKMLTQHKVDHSKIYITGLSMGGMGTFEAVYKRPGFFAAAVPICGGGDIPAYDKEHCGTPMWIFHGAIDQVVSVENSRQMYQHLLEMKANVRYTEYPEVNHNSWENAYSDPGLIPWIFSYNLNE